MPQVGLVTVLFNSDTVLEGFFASVSKQAFKDYHLYLVDNTPSTKTDELIEELIEKYPIAAYTHIKNDANVGVAKGNNQGIELAVQDGTKYTLILNNDIEFEGENFFRDFLEEAVQKKESLLIPKILFYDNRKIWMAGGEFLLKKAITSHVGEGDDDKDLYNKEKYFNYAPTCFMLVNNRVFHEVGMMDERYFVYYDDTDFLYRCYKKGFKIKYLPQFVVLHKVSSLTGGSESLFSLYYANRNRIYFINKNLTGLNYVLSLSYTLLSRTVRYVRYNSEQKKKLIKALVDGFEM
jgi:GT2 family glycosyltransferase